MDFEFSDVCLDWLSHLYKRVYFSSQAAFLLCFCQDQTERNRFSLYWKQVGPIVFGSFCLFIFDMCER